MKAKPCQRGETRNPLRTWQCHERQSEQGHRREFSEIIRLSPISDHLLPSQPEEWDSLHISTLNHCLYNETEPQTEACVILKTNRGILVGQKSKVGFPAPAETRETLPPPHQPPRRQVLQPYAAL